MLKPGHLYGPGLPPASFPYTPRPVYLVPCPWVSGTQGCAHSNLQNKASEERNTAFQIPKVHNAHEIAANPSWIHWLRCAALQGGPADTWNTRKKCDCFCLSWWKLGKSLNSRYILKKVTLTTCHLKVIFENYYFLKWEKWSDSGWDVRSVLARSGG